MPKTKTINRILNWSNHIVYDEYIINAKFKDLVHEFYLDNNILKQIYKKLNFIYSIYIFIWMIC